jgi:hypothetical protein
MTDPRTPESAPELRPELVRLVDAGWLERARRGDGELVGPGAFEELARCATRRGELTAEQASALATLLGLGLALPANDR